MEDNLDGDDLMSRISRNVEANLESFNNKPDINFDQFNLSRTPSRQVNITLNNTTNREPHVNESTFIRSDSLKSNSLLKLTDILSHNILLHPFVALRRICQVNRKCSPYICIQPFSLISFIYHQQKRQGVSALYRGLSSELLVKGLTLGTETAIANYINWPTEVSSKNSLEDFLKILTLRGISVALCTPFLCSSVIETVQSVIVFKERPSFVDCIREGFSRLLHFRSSHTSRLMPIWLLVLPTVAYQVSHLALWYISKTVIDNVKVNPFFSSKRRKTKKMVNEDISKQFSTFSGSIYAPQDLTLNHDSTETSLEVLNIEKESSHITNSIIASLMADIALLPVEAVLNSLYIQGTRTMIDNCDETTVVLPVLTNYDGFSDCYQSIFKFEGNIGLYKGLGAIVLQYSIHFLLFRSIYYLLGEFQGDSARESILSKSFSRDKQHRLQPKMKPNNRFISRNENIRHSTPNDALAQNRFKIRNPEEEEKHLDQLRSL